MGPDSVLREVWHRGRVQMKDAKTGERSKRYLWHCRGLQRTVHRPDRNSLRREPLTDAALGVCVLAGATSKKGVSALEIKRHCQISYKSALFLMNRIRFAMAPDLQTAPATDGTVEGDETYVGGKPRNKWIDNRHGPPKRKTIVFRAVERDGDIRRRVIADVTGKTLKEAIKRVVDPALPNHDR